MYHIGEIFKQIAARKGVTTETIAQQLDKTPPAVYHDFKKRDFKIATIFRYCDILKVSPAQVFKMILQEDHSLGTTTESEQAKEEQIVMLSKWLSDREELITFYRRENEDLGQRLEECLKRIEGQNSNGGGPPHRYSHAR